MFADLLKAVTAPILDGILRFIPDKNKRAEASELFNTNMLNALTALVQGQLDINKTQAQHSSIFVAGARPAVMWICAIALGWNYILQPILNWIIYVMFLTDKITLTVMQGSSAPQLDTGELTTILLGMLGLGGLRTYEKRLGVARSSIKK